MMIPGFTLYLLLLAVHESIQKSSPESLKYRAAVVELTSVLYKNDSTKTLNENADKFVGYIELAAEKGVDIVVFPELGLPSLAFVDRLDLISRSTLIPEPTQNYTLCNNSDIPVIQAVKIIACAAKRNSIYVVVNLIENEVCSGNDCPNDGIFVYLTNVVFDRKGKLISRYRKSHLLEEFSALDTMKTIELSTFDTDFGVTFGNIICFDIMYEEPWLTLTRKLNITDIIFTSGWFSEMPFLNTIQIQSGWAYAMDVNILSSGYNRVDWGLSGSGIYAGRQGVIAAILSLHDHEELLIADVWKKSNKIVVDPLPSHRHEHHLRFTSKDHEHHAQNVLSQGLGSHKFKWRYDKLDDYKTKVIVNDGFTVQKLNHFGIKCRFEVNITNLNPPLTYRFIAFDGVRPFGKVIVLGTRVCAIVQCANDTLNSCGHVQNSSATFNFIAITAMYVDNTRTVMMPSTLGSNMLPIKEWTFKEYKHKEYVSNTISITMPTQNLITFGVWGRNFEKDKKNSAFRIFNQILYLPIFLVIFENVFRGL